MTGQMGFMAKKHYQPQPPRLSLKHMLKMFEPIGSVENNAVLFIRKLQKYGVIAEQDEGVYLVGGDGYKEREVSREEANQCCIYATTNRRRELHEVNYEIKGHLRRMGPLFASLTMHANYNDNTLLYCPRGEALCKDGTTGGLLSHCVRLTGWGLSTVPGEDDTLVWEYLNSYGKDFGRDSGYGEVVMTDVVEVYVIGVQNWWD